MRNYLQEINILRREISEIRQHMESLEIEARTLESLYGISNIIHPRGMGAYGRRGSVEEKLWNAHILYESILEEHDKLLFQRISKENKLDDLREEYRMLNKRDFYQPMDNIDIYELIMKDGFINGVKF